MTCCDCGLTHVVAIEHKHDENKISMRFWRLPTVTETNRHAHRQAPEEPEWHDLFMKETEQVAGIKVVKGAFDD